VPDWHICVDFGTTFTIIADLRGDGDVEEIFTIEAFPGDRLQDRTGTQAPMDIHHLTRIGDDATDSAPASYVLYGYDTICRLELTELGPSRADYTDDGHYKKMKLFLDSSSHLKSFRHDLVQVLKQLKMAGKIKKNEDVIRNMFVHLLIHTSLVLETEAGFQSGDSGTCCHIYA
jgi:hypothetical protein